MKNLLIAVLCAACLPAFASNATATITDTDGTVWANCSYTATLTILGGTSTPAPTIGGVAVSPLVVKGVCNASGVLTATLTDTSTVDQKNVQWVFSVQSNTSAPPVTVSVPVVGASPSLTQAFSLLPAPRFSAVAGAYGYADVEVQGVPRLGVTYYNVSTPCLRQFSQAGFTCGGGGGGGGSFTASSIGTLWGFGDSTMAGSFAITPADSDFSILARDYPGLALDEGVSGAFMSGVAAQIFNQFTPVLTTTQIPVIFMNGGINDANSIGATTGAINNYKLELDAAMYWGDILPANKIMASSSTAVGFAAAFTGQGINPNNSGSVKQSITAGDTLTFIGTATGNKVGITYAPQATSVGTFTVNVNGVLQTDTCSGTTTFGNFGCNAQAVANSTFFRQEFTVTPGAFTVVVTVTGTTGATNIVSIVDVDSIPTSPAGLPVYIMSGVLRQNGDIFSAATAAFNTAALAVVTQAASDQLNVHFVDVRNGTPGVNTTTDMAANTTACPAQASNAPLHPNKCGYLDYAQTVENAVPGVFVPGINKSNTFFGPITAFTPGGSASPLFGAFESNGAAIIPSASIWAPGYCSFGNPIYCTGMNFSATQNTFTDAIYTAGTVAIQHCTGGLPSTCTDSAFWDITGNQHALLGYIGPAVAPTVGAACSPNGVWELTQDGHGSVCLALVWVQKF